jgi:hypothetical protein
MQHIVTNAEYADMLYVYGFCDGSAAAAVEEYRRRLPMCRIPDRRVFSEVFNTLHERGTLPSAQVSSERGRQQHVEEQENILKWYSVALLLAREHFPHAFVFHELLYGEHCMMTACTCFTHSMCKIYTQGRLPCV